MQVLEIRLALAIVVTEGQLPLLGRRRGRLVAGLDTGRFFSSEPWTCSESFSSSNIEANDVDDGKGLDGSTLPASRATGDLFAALGRAADSLRAWSSLLLSRGGNCEDGAEDGVDLRVADAELREDEADAVSVSEEDACPTLTLFIYALTVQQQQNWQRRQRHAQLWRL